MQPVSPYYPYGSLGVQAPKGPSQASQIGQDLGAQNLGLGQTQNSLPNAISDFSNGNYAGGLANVVSIGQSPVSPQDAADAFTGHAAYANGGQFGAGAAADKYANAASAQGTAIANANAMQGGAIANYLTQQGMGASGGFMNLGDRFSGQNAQTANYAGAQPGLNAQNSAIGMYQAAAQGNGPSAAQAQLQQGLDASIAAQQATAASARGGFGLANAQKDAAANAGQAQAQAANAAAQLRAQEQQAGMSGLSSIGSIVQQQQASNAQFNAAQRAAQQQANSANQLQAYGLGANQKLAYDQAAANAMYGWTGMGQQGQLAYNTLGQQPLTAQLSADVANQQSMSQQMQGNAQRSQQAIGGAMQGGGSALSSIAALF